MRDHRDSESLAFHKMHGLGNDFVVIDRRHTAAILDADIVRRIADRHCGVGFDQLALIDQTDNADAKLTFYNADGSLSAACGNATRCIARLLMDETGRTALALQTAHGVLDCVDAGDGLTSVNMGLPGLTWEDIPLAREVDTLHLPIQGDPVATSMGNPHCTFFVEDAEAVALDARGPTIEHHPLFPERTNVQYVHVIAENKVRMRVWERGAGVTRASGSSSCATAVAAHRRGLTGRRVDVTLDGGTLSIDWRDNGVWMTGPTAHVFSGHLTAAFQAHR
ncbi:MAG: diaminopimelate epimerase [Pseudomonadota bacterium]